MTTILTRKVARLLLLPTFIVAAAVLVKGYTDTGDGFSAGVIAVTGVLLQYVGLGYDDAERLLPVRLAPVAGFAGLLVVLAVAFLPVALGQPILTHAPAHGAEVVNLGTLELHTAVLFDLGVFMLVFGFGIGTFRLIAGLAGEDRR
ncbi:MAG: MnhB domain-containing protein [Chloroflexi bacterium]|nr:MnhB domain-containing protein [Chloroflexota bacterium]